VRFAEKVALVTGGASGIGLATAKRFGSEGARVVIADLSEEKSRIAEKEVRAAGAPDVLVQTCNVAHEDQVIHCVDETLKKFGRMDIVVNNAGLMVFKAIEELDAEDFLCVLRVDLLGAFFFTKQAFLRMKNGGVIVNVSSIHARETQPLVCAYAAAKAALLSFTRSSALEGKSKGFRVNAILPGAVDTPMLWDNPNVKSGLEKIDRGEVGKPEDLAAAIAFLASDDAAFIEGAAVAVDGGRLGKL
jgi:meso-butanediol dehydrogenase / (S,S)-butanediol dehydrogenase / diacetyl reductase